MPAAIQQSQMESDRLSAIKTIDSEIRAIEELKKSLDAESLTKALDFMQNSTGRIIITGMGKSGHIGKKIAASLASTGTPSFFVHPAEASHTLIRQYLATVPGVSHYADEHVQFGGAGITDASILTNL